MEGTGGALQELGLGTQSPWIALLVLSGCSGGALGQQPQVLPSLSPPIPGSPPTYPPKPPAPGRWLQGSLSWDGFTRPQGESPKVTGGLETSLSGEGIRACSAQRGAEAPEADEAPGGHPPTHPGSRSRSAGKVTPFLPPGTGVRGARQPLPLCVSSCL